MKCRFIRANCAYLISNSVLSVFARKSLHPSAVCPLVDVVGRDTASAAMQPQLQLKKLLDRSEINVNLTGGGVILQTFSSSQCGYTGSLTFAGKLCLNAKDQARILLFQRRMRFYLLTQARKRFFFARHMDRTLLYIVFLVSPACLVNVCSPRFKTFVQMVYCISQVTTYQNRLLFSLSTNVVDAVINEEFDSSDTHIYKSFHDIGSTEEFYQYLQNVFFNQMYSDATGFNASDVVSIQTGCDLFT